MTTFADALRMSPEDRVALGKTVLTTRWWDAQNVKALAKQSWFSRLRRDLNQSGKITFDLGVFKYEQGGSVSEPDEAEVGRLVNEIFRKTEPITVLQLQQLLNTSIESAVFTPQFLMLEGELLLQLSERSYLELATMHIASMLGIETHKRLPEPPLAAERIAELIPRMRELFIAVGGTDEILRHWMLDAGNLKKQRVNGVEMALLMLDTAGDRTKGTQVVCTLDAVKSLPDNTFGARVLGWLEHGPGSMLYIRAIAIADIFHFKSITP